MPGTVHARRRSLPSIRGGVTLLELMLVMAVLMVIAAMAYPALKAPMDNQRLRRAADQIHGEWNKTRNRAMKSGHMQVFRFQPGGDNYEICPWIGDDDPSNTADAVATPGFGDPQHAQATAPQLAKQLPADISFHGGDTAADARSAAVEQQIGAPGGWSRPILFYADGSCSTARVVLVNRRQHYIMLNLRGLTGITQVSDLLSASELPQ